MPKKTERNNKEDLDNPKDAGILPKLTSVASPLCLRAATGEQQHCYPSHATSVDPQKSLWEGTFLSPCPLLAL